MAYSQIFAFTATCLIFFFIETSISSAAIAQTMEASPLAAPQSGRTQYCEFYNSTSCPNNSSSGCYDREECEIQDPEKRNHCFVVWTKNKTTGETVISLKGCFLDSKECYDKYECIEKSYRPKDTFFCCCDGDMCNQNFTWSPSPTEATITKVGTKPVEDTTLYTTIIITMITLIAFILIMVIVFCLYFRQKKMNLFNELPTAEPSLSCPSSPEGMEDGRHLPIVLREIRARGRFGAVWRAHLNQQEVAVKIFPVQDKQSWLSEQEIFKLPRMNHTDVLQFIGVEKRGDNLQAEYWLITAYHEKGSLCDYLKANTVTWADAWRIAHSMARGLTHLHDEVAGVATVGLGRPQRRERKPAIAHRDFKSKNVLLKSDMSACIADFGLALVFLPGKPCGDTHGQVGTRRYMAPEVLEGAINFTRDAFLRIDMYACGLVLWEIASRCTAWGNVGEYMLPLEEEVGAHPSLEEMQDAVVLRKLRPNIPQTWRGHNALAVLCDTMEECWDHDAEARLSASCVMERIRSLGQMGRRAPQHQPLLIENTRPLRDD